MAAADFGNGISHTEQELNDARAAIRAALRERKSLPNKIENAADQVNEVQTDNKFYVKRLRADAKRLRGLAANLEQLEDGPVTYYSDERTALYLDYLEDAELREVHAEILEEQIELAKSKLEELVAKNGHVDIRLEALEEERDDLVEQYAAD